MSPVIMPCEGKDCPHCRPNKRVEEELLAALERISKFDALTYDMEAKGMKRIAVAAIRKARGEA